MCIRAIIYSCVCNTEGEDRATAIAEARLAPPAGTKVYNERSLSTMVYIVQLVPPSSAMIRKEKSLVQRIMHIPNNSFSKTFLYRVFRVSLPFRSLFLYRFCHRFFSCSVETENDKETITALLFTLSIYVCPRNPLSVDQRSRPMDGRFSRLVYRYVPGDPK